MTYISLIISRFYDFFANFQSLDLVDVFVIAFLMFVLLRLLIMTRSLMVIIGISSLVAIYFFALLFDLSLTKLVLQYLFGGLMIIVAIIFQKELRRFFEIIGIAGLRRKLFAPNEDTINVLMQFVWECAKSKTGALLVFPGKEPVDRHIEGGFLLDGKISKPLLMSIFDPSSPGHDGATIIDGDRVKKFATHLPLAEKLETITKFGTRHRAAIGISERTDALCIVVSEERGTVSITKNGAIRAMPENSTLEKEIRKFLKEIAPKKKIDWKNWIKYNAIPVVAALIVALSLWGIFGPRTTIVQRNFIAPIEFRNLPDGYAAEELSAQDALLTLSGKEHNFDAMNQKDLKISLDVSDLKLGRHKITIAKNFVKVPAEFSIVSVDPLSIQFKLINIATD